MASTRTDVDSYHTDGHIDICSGTLKGYTAPLVTACGPPTGDVVDVYQREFLALRDRLHAAEQESLRRSKELNLVLDEIKRAVSERQVLRDRDGNRTWGRLTGECPSNMAGEVGLVADHLSFLTHPFLTHPEDPRLKPWNVSHKPVLHLPTVFHHLPHLLAKESSLQPAVRVGQGRTGGRRRAKKGWGAVLLLCLIDPLPPAVSVVMGIPSVRREVHSYLTDTLHSLISELSPQEKEDSVIVVLIAEVSELGAQGRGHSQRGTHDTNNERDEESNIPEGKAIKSSLSFTNLSR